MKDKNRGDDSGSILAMRGNNSRYNGVRLEFLYLYFIFKINNTTYSFKFNL